MLSGKDGMADADSLIEAAETIKQDLQQQAEGTLIKEIFSKADENLINSAGDFVYDNLPCSFPTRTTNGWTPCLPTKT